MAKEKIIVTFLKGYEQFVRGDVAGIDPELAEKLALEEIIVYGEELPEDDAEGEDEELEDETDEGEDENDEVDDEDDEDEKTDEDDEEDDEGGEDDEDEDEEDAQ